MHTNSIQIVIVGFVIMMSCGKGAKWKREYGKVCGCSFFV